MQWLGRTDGEAELRQAPPAGDGLSEAIRHLLRTKPGTIAVGNAGGGECGPLSLSYDGTRDRPGRSQTGERRADLVRFARENPGLLLLEFPAKTTISLSQAVARSFRGYAHQYEAEPTFEMWCSAMACPGFKYDEAAFMISALVDNRAVVIYPTGKGGVEGPIVYTADPTSCRGARHLALDRDTEHVVTLRQMSGTWAYEEATSGFVLWEAALGSQPPSGAPGGRLWPDAGAAQQSGLGTSGDNRITGDRRGFRAGGRPAPPPDSKEGGSSFLTSPPP